MCCIASILFKKEMMWTYFVILPIITCIIIPLISAFLCTKQIRLKTDNTLRKYKIIKKSKTEFEKVMECEIIGQYIYESICDAVKNGDFDKIKQILSTKIIEKIFNTEDIVYNPIEVLMHFIKNDKYDIFEMVIKYIDIDVQDTDGYTLLKHLIGDIAYDDFYGEYYQSYNVKTENRILYVLNFVKNINITDHSGATALCDYVETLFACKMDENKTKIIKKMLELDADLNCECVNGSTVFHMAVCNIDALKLLLEYSSAKGSQFIDISVLHHTLKNCNYSYDIIELLLSYIKDINEKDMDGNGIDFYVSDNINEDVKVLLIENGAFL